MEAVRPSEQPQERSEFESSEIQQYFTGTTIFITGGTGFLGKVLVEKLLRTCHNLKKIYILVRSKKNKNCQKRFEEYFNEALYSRLKVEQPKSLEKLCLIQGDCELPNLGLSDEDTQRITSEVNCIFHVAATVRFNENLRTAAFINVRATRDILNMAKKVKNLQCLLHVSTAYSFCTRQKIDETFYEPGMRAEDLLAIANALTAEQLDAMTPILLKDCPNTYVFTKGIAEDLIKREGADLPVAIVRPSIIMLTTKDPFPGWVDNYYGATGLFTGIALGVVRTMCYKLDCVSDQIPVDYVVSNMIAAAWNAVSSRKVAPEKEITEPEDIPIYNCVSGARNPITWEQCNQYGQKHVKHCPSMHMQWHYFMKRASTLNAFLFYHFFLHVFPAYTLDLFMTISGNKPILIKTYNRIRDTVEIISYFTTKTWEFKDENTQALWKKLGEKDKELFEFDVKLLNWDTFYKTFLHGTRVYLLKDPMSTLENAKRRALKFRVAHYILVLAFMYISLKIVLFLVNVFVGMIF